MGTDIHSCAEAVTGGSGWYQIGHVFRRGGPWPSPGDIRAAEAAGMTHEPFDWEWRSRRLFAFLAGVRNRDQITPIAEPRGLPADVTEETLAAYEKDQDDNHHVSWLSVAEMVFYDYNRVIPGLQIGKDAGGTAVAPAPGTTVASYLMDTGYFSRLADLAALDRGETETRIVFWFDN